jgi:hypothetical protein
MFRKGKHKGGECCQIRFFVSRDLYIYSYTYFSHTFFSIFCLYLNLSFRLESLFKLT